MKKGDELIMKLCPRCKQNPLDPIEVRNALSRKDNQTYICAPCGNQEAIEEYLEWERRQED